MNPSFFQRRPLLLAGISIILIIILGFIAFSFYLARNPELYSGTTLLRPSHETYLKLQAGLKEIRPGWNGELNKESLRLGDVDGDGDTDVVGFMTSSLESGASQARLVTWLQEGEKIRLYEDGYDDFRIPSPEACKVQGISTGALTLDCTSGAIGRVITLRYQPTGIGYYRDFAAEAIVYEPQEGWRVYESASSGLSFSHPSDITIEEEGFKKDSGPLSILTGKRGTSTVFQIVTEASEPSKGGGVLSSNSSSFALVQLSDGSYLSRVGNHTAVRISYNESFVGEVNNEGSIFSSIKQHLVKERARHSILVYPASNIALEETDLIFSSLMYGKAAFSAPAHPTPSSVISFDNGFSLTVPAYIEPEPVSQEEGALEARRYLMRVIPVEGFTPISLSVSIHPFGSVGVLTRIGGGGYDADSGQCYQNEKDNTSAPNIINGIKACGYLYRDGSEGAHGYYLLDPARRYIAHIRINGGYDTSLLNLDSVVQTARFAP
jgi:hypothetical protein